MSLSESSHIPPLGATIHQLKIKPIFDALENREKFYAHYLARAAWHGSRIIMRQVSSESPNIFDFIIGLYHACDGKRDTLVAQCNIASEELASFLEYAAMFLCNLGNFYGEGNQKFVPGVTAETPRKIANISPETKAGMDKIINPLLAVPPFSLGCPSKTAQSGCYPSDEPITRDEITKVSEVMNMKSIGPENNRIRKVVKNGKPVLQLLQASRKLAKEYAGNDKQTQFLTHYIECFRTGSLDAFQESQKAWVTDVSARVDKILGFNEPYRDPAGIRSVWEAMIGIADADEIKRLKNFVDSSTTLIRQPPWAVKGVNDGKGPFEKGLLEAPDFTSVHG
ncbi:MAG: hypothetical protein Q9180_008499 [Flavoplaca navasiana]